MLKRGQIFSDFFAKFPGAQRHEFKHENGKSSTIAIGLTQGEVDEAFIGVYGADGALLSEVRPDESVLQESLKQRNLNQHEVLEFLKEHVSGRTGSPIKTL